MKIAKTSLMLAVLALGVGACATDSKKSGSQKRAQAADATTDTDTDTDTNTATSSEAGSTGTATSATCSSDASTTTSGSGLTDAAANLPFTNDNVIFDQIQTILQCIRNGSNCLSELGNLGGSGNAAGSSDLTCFNGFCFDKFGRLVSTNTSTATSSSTATSATSATTSYDPCATYGWSEVRLIFEISCNSCHTHTKQFTTEELVRSHKSAIMSSLEDGSMPQYPTQIDANSRAKLLHYLKGL